MGDVGGQEKVHSCVDGVGGGGLSATVVGHREGHCLLIRGTVGEMRGPSLRGSPERSQLVQVRTLCPLRAVACHLHGKSTAFFQRNVSEVFFLKVFFKGEEMKTVTSPILFSPHDRIVKERD